MATATIPENDGPALALSVLYEANDLLNAMRTVSENARTQWARQNGP